MSDLKEEAVKKDQEIKKQLEAEAMNVLNGKTEEEEAYFRIKLQPASMVFLVETVKKSMAVIQKENDHLAALKVALKSAELIRVPKMKKERILK